MEVDGDSKMTKKELKKLKKKQQKKGKFPFLKPHSIPFIVDKKSKDNEAGIKIKSNKRPAGVKGKNIFLINYF